MPKTVLIISTLNTKREETLYLKEQVETLGLKALLMDISMRGDGASEADIQPDRRGRFDISRVRHAIWEPAALSLPRSESVFKSSLAGTEILQLKTLSFEWTWMT